MMKLLKNEQGIARIYILAAIVVGVLTLFIIGLIQSNDRGVGTGDEYSPPNGPAIMNNSEEVYRLVDDTQFSQLRTDLAYFARDTMETYKSGKTVDVIFVVGKSITKNNQNISFEGKFKESKDTISVSITREGKSRIKSTILNKKSRVSIDNKLPSNSKRNQYIATLPIDNDDYAIEYDTASDSFVITIYTISDTVNPTARLMESLGLKNLEEEKVNIIATGSYGERGLPEQPVVDPEGLD